MCRLLLILAVVSLAAADPRQTEGSAVRFVRSKTDSSAVSDEECASITMPATLRLKNRLLCEYDPEVRPVKEHTNITDVSYSIYLQSMLFHEDINFLEVRTWVEMKWRDEHLVWDKDKNSGLDKLTVRCNRIWMPDVALTSGPTPTATQSASLCLVRQDGSVRAGMPVIKMAACVPDIRRWPFDTHNCTMRVSSWSYYADQINLTTDNAAVFANNFKNGRDWELLQATSLVYTRVYPPPRNITWPCISYSFILKRHSGDFAATIVTPGVVLAIMTLVTFWMDPTENQRMDLIRLNLLCHCMYLIYLEFRLPGNGDNTPLIITFFRDSFIMATFSFLIALCATRMSKSTRAAPAWITSIVNSIARRPPAQFLLLGDLDTQGGEDSSAETRHGCGLLGTLLDRVCFLVFTISLIILLGAFVPQE